MSQLPIRNLRLRAFTAQALSSVSGQQGDVYYDRTADTLRVFTGQGAAGGSELARADLANVSLESFVDRAEASGLFGANIHIHNRTNNQDSGYDYVTFRVGTAPITALYLTRYVASDQIAWFGLQQGSTWTAGLNPALMLLQSHFGPGAPVGYRVGDNILAQTSTVLTANTQYTMRIQQTGSTLTEYAFSTNRYWIPSSESVPGDYSGNPAQPTILYQQGGGGGAGSGDVVGPNTSTDNALARFDQTTGKILQNSLVTVSDTGAITAPAVGNIIPFLWADQSQFPSASTYHGAIAHSHADGRVYFAHSAAWVALANQSDIPSLGNLSFGGGSITTTDSSAITVIPQTRFQSNVLVDSDVVFMGQGAKRLGNQEGGYIEFSEDITVDPKTSHDFVVDTYNGATHYVWRFDSGGDLVFPNGTVQTTAFTGSVGSINGLSDVDTVTTPPVVGQVLKWNGTNWVPAADATAGGSGTDADTLDGLDSSYFLNFNNLSNKPSIFSTIAVAGQSNVVADSVTDTLTLVAGTGIQITTVAGTDTITIANTLTDTNTTYAISAETVAGGANLRLTGSDASTDDVKIAAGTNVTVTRTDANTITVASANTTYSVSAETNGSNADIRLTGSDASTDSVTIAAGANVTITRTDANTITIASTATGGGGGTVTSVGVTSANGFAATIVNPSTEPNITLTTTVTGMVKGNGTALSAALAGTDFQAPISLTTTGSSGAATFVGNTLNIPNYSTATTFNSLTDATTAGLTIDEVYLPAITMLMVGNVGNSAYTFDQYSGSNPTIYAISGTTIAFKLGNLVGSHPFLIQSGGVNYNDGLIHVAPVTGEVSTGSSAQGKVNGTVYWKIPAGAAGSYTYQCSLHPAMVGTISVKNIASI